MTFSHFARALVALVCMSGAAMAQSPYEPPSSLNAPYAEPRPAPQPKRVSTGTCVILKGEQIIDQQNCRALAAVEDTANGSAAAGFANGITYVWPSGNRTVVGGADDEFNVNGNVAIPLPDEGRGLCLRVEKTGNTFCYKDGAKIKAAAAQPLPAVPAGAAPAQAPSPVDARRAPPVPPVPGVTTVVPAAALADETKLRKAAEEEVKSLRAEVAKLTANEEKRVAELAEYRKAAEAEAGKSADAEKARMAAVLKEIDQLKSQCANLDAAACERALALAREASVTGSLNTTTIGELEQLRGLAIAPLGIQSLAFLGGVPRSTLIVSVIAAGLALSLLLMMGRRTVAMPQHVDFGVSMPSLDVPPHHTAPQERPSLDPFSLTLPAAYDASAFPTAPDPQATASAATPAPGPLAVEPRMVPPPIPDYASMQTLFPAQKDET